MTNETDLPPGKQVSVRGCLTIAAIFLVFTLGGALVTLAVYTFVVDSGLIEVPRDFGYEMIIYAPLAGLACGFVAAFWAARGGLAGRRAPMLLSLGLIVALGLLLVFFAFGMLL